MFGSTYFKIGRPNSENRNAIFNHMASRYEFLGPNEVKYSHDVR